MERRIVQCNYVTGTRVASLGARAYVVRANPGGCNDRILVLARSRGGRWIEKWESIKVLGNFRIRTMPDARPLSGRELLDASGTYARALLQRVS
jgi:hypothetical protein